MTTFRAVERRKSEQVAALDCVFLCSLVLLSAAPYIAGLGFASDDWSALGAFHAAADRSLAGLYRAVESPAIQMRPLQVLYVAGSYLVFGERALGYHVLNALVMSATAVAFALALRELGVERLLAVTLPAVYALLPHYSTVRVWLLSHSVAVSMLLYFVSLYADLRALHGRGAAPIRWKGASVLALVGSLMSYELTVGLFLANCALVYLRASTLRRSGASIPAHRPILLALGTVAPLIAIVAFKLVSTDRVGELGLLQNLLLIARQAVSLHYGGEAAAGLNIKAAAEIGVGTYGIGLPLVVWRLLRGHFRISSVLAGLGVGTLVILYLSRVAARAPELSTRRRELRQLIACGIAAVALGYAVFLTNWNIQFTPTGVANRTAMAAAVGFAILFVGVIGWAASLLPGHVAQRRTFCALVAALCAGGALINGTIASFWAEAYAHSSQVLASMRRDVPALPRGATVLLDGVCPYEGPGIVFESSWDLAGALVLTYNDATLRADVVTPSLQIENDGVHIFLYGAETIYRYDRLLVYDAVSRRSHALSDADEARRYFTLVSPDRGRRCPHGYAGHGVSIF